MANREQGDRFTEVADQYTGYQVYDQHYEKIGKVDDLFVDETDRPEYVGVKMGFLGTRSTLIPMDLIRVNDQRRLMEVAADQEQVKNGPTFEDDREITPDLEREIRGYYGLEAQETSTGRGGYGSYYRDEDYETGGGESYERDRVDLEPGERSGEVYDYEERGGTREARGREERGGSGEIDSGTFERDTEGVGFRGRSEGDEVTSQRRDRDLEDENELRVQRSEEELRAGTREREAGSVNVRKRVRADRERVRVPKRREEVSVERVPVQEGTASEDEIGDDEVRIPVVEEEVVVEKRPVVKEELRIRKDIVEDEEVVEEDVRKEEVEVDDETDRPRS